MATHDSNKYRSIILDGEARDITPGSKISDLAPDSATSVVVTSPTGESRTLNRSDFNKDTPPGSSINFNHSLIIKG
ncbi:hypothetical protein AGMMS50256_17410 [Betaproteobacteria bacterium]|nr:hypothetical protein AGMMS50256_17410 [Betaproteobacteria bacterium]